MQPILDPINRRAALARLAGGAALAVSATSRGAIDDDGKRPPARIFAFTFDRMGATPQPISGIVSIDPEDGTWTKVAPTSYTRPRASPDGRLVLCFRMAVPPDDGLYLCDSDGGEPPRKLAGGQITDYCWSPDGKEILFSERTMVDFKTWRMKPDGTGRVEVPIAENDSVLDWSPDGRWLLTASWRGVEQKSLRAINARAVYLVHPDGTGERRLFEPSPFRPAFRFSPDAKTVVFHRPTVARGGPYRLEMIDVDGKEARTFLGPREHEGPVQAVWSPDGKELAVLYMSDDGQPITVDTIEKLTYHLEIVSADGKRSRRHDVLEGIRFGLGDWR
ncbi:MAG TPA: WD40 repeat domain-containing protein [Isosphaeraceae bacterium]|jgi:Tol biopolymer transport system component|nr:WD40 repeat domain-containing protein [Isosphaeraceae bacterium]